MNQNLHKVTKEDDEKSIELIDEWGMGDIEVSGGEECNAFKDMFPPIPPPDYLIDPCNGMPNNNSDLSGVLPVPDDEIAELEWLSTFVDDSLSTGGITLDNNKKDDSCRFRTSNPVSVLKNSSSCSGGKTMPLSPDTVVPGRVRGKRPRTAVFYQPPALNVASLKSCKFNGKNQPLPNSYISSESEYFSETHPPYTPKFSGEEQKKMKKKKKKRQPPSMPINSSDHDNSLQQQQQSGVAVQKCSHCAATKTSLWRGGPMGRGTLCNACGIRYNSGRLFPEYRPAVSPTFVASVHSHSHKKVVEMRVTGTPAR